MGYSERIESEADMNRNSENPGYFDSNRRSAFLQSARDNGASEDTIKLLRTGMHKTLMEMDKYLFHIYYLRDEAIKAISEGRLDDANSLLKRIGI